MKVRVLMAIDIAPSILSADFTRLGEQVAQVETAGASILHIDVMDGHFVPNLTLGPPVIKALRPVTRMRFDVHLMIDNPEYYIEDFVRAGADHLTVHAESTRHLHRLIQQIKASGVTVGVALNPATPLDSLTYILEELDLVLLMTVNPGFGGQHFLPAVLPKIRELAQDLRERNPRCRLEVDGGVNRDTARAAVEAGARLLVAGNAVFSAPDPGVAWRDLQDLVN